MRKAEIRKYALEALRRRGLDERAIREFRIGYDPRPKDFQPSVDKLLFYERLGFFNATGYIPAGRIVLPFFEYGKPVYVQFWDWNHRDGPNFKYLNPSGWQKKPVGFDLIRRDKPVYLVEGIFDWLSMRQAGYIAVCTLGTSVNLEYQEYLKRASHIYIMFDNDQKADNPG
jgi:DNA primase